MSSATHSSASMPLHQLADYLRSCDEIADRQGYTDPRLRPAYYKHVMMVLTQAYVEVFATSVEKPDWVPHITFYYPWGAPNPDDIYRFAPIEGTGVYRFSGVKGTAPVSLVTMRTGGAHIGQINGRVLGEIDLNSLATDQHGRYNFVLSRERPAGHDGAWHALHPDTQSLLFRSRTNKGSETDAVCVIERMDTGQVSVFPDAESFAHKMAMLTQYAARQNEFLLNYLNSFRARGGDTGFVADDQSGHGGVVNQRVLMHLFTLEDDEALLVETELPETVRYWSIQSFDAHFSAVDFVFHQSALNGENVRVDADGRVRLVACARDPGVANWIDTGGWPSGGLFWRWSYASGYPVPTVKKIKLRELNGLLPSTTARVDATERRAMLSRRVDYYQTRSR
jgi:hypothetical protein